MTTPLGSEGAVHEIVSWTTPGMADRPETGPGTACIVTHTNKATVHYSLSCSVSTVRAVLYGPVPSALTAATCTE